MKRLILISQNFVYVLRNVPVLLPILLHCCYRFSLLVLTLQDLFYRHHILFCKQISFIYRYLQNTFDLLKNFDINNYLAVSYCRTVNNVSSIVLLQSVFTEETKKFKAPSNVSPFLVKFLWVSELYRNSSCNSGDFCANSENASPKACCVWTTWWKWEAKALDNRKTLQYFLWVSLNNSICVSSSINEKIL